MQVELWVFAVDLDETVVEESATELRRQVREYARGERETFDLTVAFPEGFTGEVMRAMAAIPYGETRTYGDLARVVESSPVAVGGACGRNPLPVVVPCHRVVGADSLGGFSARGGVDLKRRLLEHEVTTAVTGETATAQSSLAAYGGGREQEPE